MKTSICLCSILALLAISLTVAQTDQGKKTPPALLALFHEGDHIGFNRNTDFSGYLLSLYTDQEIEKVKSYYSNQKENAEQLNKLFNESRATELTASPERKAELTKKMAELRRPTSAPIGKVFAIGTDYIGIVQLDNGSELYIPISRIVSVSRKRSVPAEAVQN